MSEIQFKPEGKQDPKLEYVLNLCKETVQMFLKAMEKMTVGMKFKAIELKNLSPEEVTPTVDLLSTAIAIELNSQAKETIQEITYNCYMEKVENEEGAYDLWITAKREKPDWTKVPKIEETPIQELRKQEKESESESQSEKVEKESDSRSEQTHYTNAINFIV